MNDVKYADENGQPLFLDEPEDQPRIDRRIPPPGEVLFEDEEELSPSSQVWSARVDWEHLNALSPTNGETDRRPFRRALPVVVIVIVAAAVLGLLITRAVLH